MTPESSKHKPGLPGPSLKGLIILTPGVLFTLLLIGCASSSTDRSRENDSLPAPYTRVARPDPDTIELQIAVRRFVPAKGRGPEVWLSAVSHIGESNYYATLQQHLDRQSLVLFEGVGARDKTIRFDPAKQSSIQHTLATSLGLVFQLAAIDYDRPNFQNSDLTLEELQTMMSGGTIAPQAGEPAAAPAAGEGTEMVENEELQTLMGVMDGSSMLGALVHVGIKFLGSSPKLQAMTKLAMIETLGRFQGDLSEVKSIPPQLQKLMHVIIRGRNDIVLRDLRPHLGRGNAQKPVSVFYGAGHMVDLETRLTRELGYRPRGEHWLTALAVNTRHSGLTPAELQMVRGLVQWQLDALEQR